MNYATAMNSIDTAKALNFLEIEATPNGSYLKFPCPKCQKEAVIKTYGDKKNVWFCPECRGAGQIISLTGNSLLPLPSGPDYNSGSTAGVRVSDGRSRCCSSVSWASWVWDRRLRRHRRARQGRRVRRCRRGK